MVNRTLCRRMAPTRRPRKAPNAGSTRKSTWSTRLLSAAEETSVPFEYAEEMQDIIRRRQSSTRASTAANDARRKAMERRMEATDQLLHDNMQALLQSVAKPINAVNDPQHRTAQEATTLRNARHTRQSPWPSYNQGANAPDTGNRTSQGTLMPSCSPCRWQHEYRTA